MPTKYTLPIFMGARITFRAFAIRCARAEDAFAEIRDRQPDAARPTASERRLAQDRASLLAAEAMSDDEADRRAEEWYRREEGMHAVRLREAGDLKARYEAMIAQVVSWEPPLPLGERSFLELKWFMLDQLS